MNRSHLRLLLRGGFSVGLVALLLSRVRWHELGGLLRSVHLGPLLLATALTGVTPLLMALRGKLLLRQWGIDLHYRTMLSITWLGQFCNGFLPGSTGGDLVKFYQVCRLSQGSKAAVFAGLFADRLSALVALILLAGTMLVFGDHTSFWMLLGGVSFSGTLARYWWLAPPALVFGGLGLAVAWRFGGRHARAAQARLTRVWAELRVGLHAGPLLGGAFGIALLIHGLCLTSYFLIARALEIPATYGQMALVWPVVTVAVLLPLSVNGYGLREFIVLYYFQHWHLVSGLRAGTSIMDTVVALSLLSVMNESLCNLPGAFCLFARRREQAREKQEAVAVAESAPSPEEEASREMAAV